MIELAETISQPLVVERPPYRWWVLDNVVAMVSIDNGTTAPGQKLDNRPYKVLITSGDWTCSIAHFTGTMTGPMTGPDGMEIPPTGRKFDVEFCTVARWDNGQIVEENLFYDLVTFMRQIGLGGSPISRSPGVALCAVERPAATMTG